jgi:hypothetical protein
MSSHTLMHGAVGGTGHLCGTSVYGSLRAAPVTAVLRAAGDITVPHVAVPIVVSVVAVLVTGVVAIVGKYLFFYARNRRARSIAEIRKAAIEGKIAVSDAEKLIRADVGADADPQQVAEGDATGEMHGTGNDSEDAERAPLRPDSTPALSATERVTLMLHRIHLF